MATPIQFTDGKSGTKKRRGRKTALPGYYACLSRDLLLMASGADTHTYTNVRRRNNFKKPGTRGLRPRAPGLKILQLLQLRTTTTTTITTTTTSTITTTITTTTITTMYYYYY